MKLLQGKAANFVIVYLLSQILSMLFYLAIDKPVSLLVFLRRKDVCLNSGSTSEGGAVL